MSTPAADPLPYPTRLAAGLRAAYPSLPAAAPAALLAGAVAGMLWGVVARGWMRLIAHDPEFTREGTLGIVIIFAVFGLGQAIATVLRRRAAARGGRRAVVAARSVAVLTTVPMGMAAGALMLPSLLLGGIAFAIPARLRRLRLGVALAAFLPTLWVAWVEMADSLPLWHALAGWALMLAVYAPLVVALGRSLAR